MGDSVVVGQQETFGGPVGEGFVGNHQPFGLVLKDDDKHTLKALAKGDCLFFSFAMTKTRLHGTTQRAKAEPTDAIVN